MPAKTTAANPSMNTSSSSASCHTHIPLPSAYSNGISTPTVTPTPSNTTNTTTTTAQTLRTHLHHLLPKHTQFNVSITIHQLSSVPYVHGEFGVKWKFSDVVSSGGGLLGRIRGKRVDGDKDKGKGKEKAGGDGLEIRIHDENGYQQEQEHEHEHSSPSSSRSYPLPSSPSPYAHQPHGSKSQGTVYVLSSPHTPSHPYSDYINTELLVGNNAKRGPYAFGTGPPSPMTPLTAIHGGSGSAFPSSSRIPSTNGTRVNTPSISHPNLLSTLSSSFTSSHHPPSSSSHPSTQVPPSPRQTKSEISYSSTRGSTPYVPLESHSSKWEFPLNVVVEMGVGKENELEGCEVRFGVRQRVIANDPNNNPSNPRLGHIVLNLAEYVDKGPVTRNYLLRESKVNAVLKLTTHVTYLSGYTLYIAPPLKKGEIMAGVKGLLKGEGDAYRSPPWLRGLVEAYGEDADADAELALGRGARPVRRRGISQSGLGLGLAGGVGRSGANTPSGRTTPASSIPFPPFEFSRISEARGPRTTEALIEALFNPVPSLSPTHNPFTYYVGEGDGDESSSGGSGSSSGSWGTSESSGREGDGESGRNRAEREVDSSDGHSVFTSTTGTGSAGCGAVGGGDAGTQVKKRVRLLSMKSMKSGRSVSSSVGGGGDDGTGGGEGAEGVGKKWWRRFGFGGGSGEVHGQSNAELKA